MRDGRGVLGKDLCKFLAFFFPDHRVLGVLLSGGGDDGWASEPSYL